MNKNTEHIESSPRYIDANEITGPLTAAIDFAGDMCVIIGKPFTNDHDESYIIAKDLIKKLEYKNIRADLKDVYEWNPDAEDAEYFVFATDGQYVDCFVYDECGVVGIK